MIHTIRKAIAYATAFSLSWATLGSAYAEELEPTVNDNKIIPPKAIYKPDPSHPQHLYDKGIEGKATIVVIIDELGTVIDPMVEKETDEEFGIAAMLAASEWTFEPAMQGGVPLRVKARIPFEFNIAFEHQLNVEMGREVFKQLEIPVLPSFELDKTPLPTFVPAFVDFYPEEFHNTGKSAAVSVEFIIDPNGKVVNPRVISISAAGFEESAIRAVSHMKYEPIRVNGALVHVSLMMPIQLSQ